jgi:hypothetical protein
MAVYALGHMYIYVEVSEVIWYEGTAFGCFSVECKPFCKAGWFFAEIILLIP